MKRWLLVLLAVFGVALAQEPLKLQKRFSFRINPDNFSLSLESLIVKPQSTASMWYADIPNNVAFSMQFVEVAESTEYFIYPSSQRFKWPVERVLPQLEKPW